MENASTNTSRRTAQPVSLLCQVARSSSFPGVPPAERPIGPIRQIALSGLLVACGPKNLALAQHSSFRSSAHSKAPIIHRGVNAAGDLALSVALSLPMLSLAP